MTQIAYEVTSLLHWMRLLAHGRGKVDQAMT